MVRRRRAGVVGALGLSLTSFVLVGYTGYAMLSGSPGRHKAVASRTASVTLTGYDDQYYWYPVCAYQQTRNPDSMATLGCVWPSTVGAIQDACGRWLYPFSMTVSLLGNDENWSKDRSTAEYTRVFFARSGSGGSIYTMANDDYRAGSDSAGCHLSRAAENLSVAAITFYNNTVPADLTCSGTTKSFAGCPYSCNLEEGCDVLYGRRENNYYDAAYRTNADGQTTVLTRYDHYGMTAGSGTPFPDWSYQTESGVCSGGSTPGAACDADANCPGGGTCPRYYTVMRRNALTGDSLNMRRGDQRRNTLVEAWVKMKYVDANNQEIGLVNRFYSNNNYFAFVVREYGGDYAQIHKIEGGSYYFVAGGTPSLTLTSWTRIGFKVRDLGSYDLDRFVPSGNCEAVGQVGGVNAVSLASTPCAFAPNGHVGALSYYNSNAQFWDLDAYPCSSSGNCYK